MLKEDKKIYTTKSGKEFIVTDSYKENHGSAPYSEHTLELSQLGSTNKKDGMYIFYSDVEEKNGRYTIKDSQPTIGTYKNGKKEGAAYIFSGSGDLEFVEIYENGGLTKSYDKTNAEFVQFNEKASKIFDGYNKMLNVLREAGIEFELPRKSKTSSGNVFNQLFSRLSKENGGK